MVVPVEARSLYMVIKDLSAGQQGAQNEGVCLVKSKRTGTCFIEKRVDPRDIRLGKSIREVKALIQLRAHPNIVEIRDMDLDYSRTGYGSIYMQHCELGSLQSLMERYHKKHKLLDDESFMYKVFWEVSLALCYMSTGVDHLTIRKYAHEGKKISRKDGWNATMHRDLKPGNIFLTNVARDRGDINHHPRIVVGDFGCSVSMTDVHNGIASRDRHSGVTPCFAPPESPKYYQSGDVYTLGLMINCLARMQHGPTEDMAAREQDPLRGLYKDPELICLVRKCLRKHADDRPTTEELPHKVLEAYKTWRSSRSNDGAKLPDWAFG